MARWLTRGNAALWVRGGPPPRLRLDLPDGPRMAAPAPAAPCPARLYGVLRPEISNVFAMAFSLAGDRRAAADRDRGGGP